MALWNRASPNGEIDYQLCLTGFTDPVVCVLRRSLTGRNRQFPYSVAFRPVHSRHGGGDHSIQLLSKVGTGNWLYGLMAPVGIFVGAWVAVNTLGTVIMDKGIQWRGSLYR